MNTEHILEFALLTDEYWWGISSALGDKMPFYADTFLEGDLLSGHWGDKAVPFLVSNKGRYVWCDAGFKYRLHNGVWKITAYDAVPELVEAGTTLREAFLSAAAAHFPAGGTPPEAFFSAPQYNTWMELTYDQTQASILRYASGILDSGLQPGVLMIDDGWMQYYGRWQFDASAFPDPKGMIAQLHAWGFTVMLWVCPFVSADSPEFRQIEKTGGFVRDANGAVRIIKWWNGYSALLDLTNPKDMAWFKNQLDLLMQTYAVDGFKFDAGEADYYLPTDQIYRTVSANENSRLYNIFAANYPYNELRVAYNSAGLPIVQRLGDKPHEWENGLQQLIPSGLAQSMLGYAFACPDMVGGGALGFVDKQHMDPELSVRYAMCSALFPMMQFSVALWRYLPDTYAKLCIASVKIREKYRETILRLAEESGQTGAPMIRCMEYVFPGKGYALEKEQFMLGDKILVAPVLQAGVNTKTVLFPEGIWCDAEGKKIIGPCKKTVPAPIDVLPVFVRCD